MSAPSTRAQQIRVNLERARWVVGGVTGLSDTFLLVNLPAFKVVSDSRSEECVGDADADRHARRGRRRRSAPT